MNANTATASNGPTIKYHCTVALAEKKNKTKQKYNKKTNKTKRHLVNTGKVNI